MDTKYKKIIVIVIPILLVFGIFNFKGVLKLKAEEDKMPYSIESLYTRGTQEVNQPFVNAVMRELVINRYDEINLKNLSKIKSLEISDQSLKEIPFLINYMDNLEELKVENCNIYYIHPDIEEKILSLDKFSVKGNSLISVSKELIDAHGEEAFEYNLLNSKNNYYLDINRDRGSLSDIDGLIMNRILEENTGDELQEELKKIIKKVHLDRDNDSDIFDTSKELLREYGIDIEEIPSNEVPSDKFPVKPYKVYYKVKFRTEVTNLDWEIIEVPVEVEVEKPEPEPEPGEEGDEDGYLDHERLRFQ